MLNVKNISNCSKKNRYFHEYNIEGLIFNGYIIPFIIYVKNDPRDINKIYQKF